MTRDVDVQKGKEYRITCKLKSTGCDKWVFIKIATKENFAYGKWIWLTKGSETTVDETFTAENNADTLTFDSVENTVTEKQQTEISIMHTQVEQRRLRQRRMQVEIQAHMMMYLP